MSSLENLKNYFVDQPTPLIGTETIQVILLREIHDFTVLRTEETRELNTVVTPLSIKESAEVRRVAFLASKQKAAESRMLEQLLRSATKEVGLKVDECYLKDNLCLNCPRCAIYGGTKTKPSKTKEPNIKHRIEYSTAFSLLPYEDIEHSVTFNAIDDKSQTTGQALGTRYAVVPASVFPSIITFRGVSFEEFILAMKAIIACKSYGAETRIGGDVRNQVVGIIAGWEEIITSLELMLELYDVRQKLAGEKITSVLEPYKKFAGNIDKVKILEFSQVEEIVKEIGAYTLTKEFMTTCYKQVQEYRKTQNKK